MDTTEIVARTKVQMETKIPSEQVNISWQVSDIATICPPEHTEFGLLYSPEFCLGESIHKKSTWCLSTLGFEGYLSFYINIVEIEKSGVPETYFSNNDEIAASMTLVLKNAEDTLLNIARVSKFVLKHGTPNAYGWERLIKLESLWTERKNINIPNALRFEVCMHIHGDPVHNTIFSESESKLQSDLHSESGSDLGSDSECYHNSDSDGGFQSDWTSQSESDSASEVEDITHEEDDDVWIDYGDQRICMHRSTLIDKSRIFEAMLNRESLKEIKIPELADIDTASVFADFMYLGIFSDILDKDKAERLLITADTYELPSLSEAVLKNLTENLSAYNVGEITELIERYLGSDKVVELLQRVSRLERVHRK